MLFGLNLLSFFTSKAGLALIAVTLVAAMIGVQTARLNHAKSELSDLKASDKAASDHAHLLEANASKISETASVHNQAVQTGIRTVTRTIIKWIPAHVAPTDPNFYPWPTWSVRAYNASLGLPDAPGGPDDSSSGLGAADAAPVFVANNGACREDQARLAGLQGWVRAQAANR